MYSTTTFYKIIAVLFGVLLFVQCNLFSDDDMDSDINPEEEIEIPEEPSVEETIENGLLMYLPFDGDGEDLVNSDHQTILKNCEFVTDRLGNAESALYLNGIDSYVDIISPFSIAQDFFTISFWMKNLSLSDGGNYIFCLRQNSYCNVKMDTYNLITQLKFKRNLGSDPVYSAVAEADANIWQHIVIRYDKSEHLELFIDGLSADRIPVGYGVFSESDTRTGSAIGCYNRPNALTGFWKGRIDEVKIYDRMLSIEEIEYLSN